MDNQKGLTLIEVVAAVLLLAIILISVFTFLTNSFHFNVLNDNSIQAMNIAREKKASIYDNYSWAEITADSTIDLEKRFINDSNSPYYYKVESHDGYETTIYIKKTPETGDFYRKLHQVLIEVRKDGRLISETFTYYERTGLDLHEALFESNWTHSR